MSAIKTVNKFVKAYHCIVLEVTIEDEAWESFQASQLWSCTEAELHLRIEETAGKSK